MIQVVIDLHQILFRKPRDLFLVVIHNRLSNATIKRMHRYILADVEIIEFGNKVDYALATSLRAFGEVFVI